MTRDDVRKILKCPRKAWKLAALSYVSLGELELDVIYLRYFLLLTQERAADRIPRIYADRLGIPLENAIAEYSLSTVGLQKIEYRALEKCQEAWDGNILIKWILEATQ